MATTVTQNEPWGPQGDMLKFGYDKTKQVFNNQFGQPFDPYSATTKASLAGIKGVAAGNNPFLQPATDAVTGIASGADSINGSMFGDIYGQSQQPGFLAQPGFYDDVASGNMMDSNPFREAALDDALGRTSDSIRASMSSKGRYGSGFYGDSMARGLGGVAANFNLNAYNSDMDRALGAAQGRSAEDLARAGIGLSAAQGATGVQGQNIANRMNAAGMAPGMNDLRYADAQRMAGVGAAEDQMAEAIRNRDWDLVGKMQNMFGSIPGSAGSSTTDTPDPSSWLNLIGGASAGAGIGSMFGLPGAAIGAGIGGLGSWLFG